jgi:hypothetical protein
MSISNQKPEYLHSIAGRKSPLSMHVGNYMQTWINIKSLLTFIKLVHAFKTQSQRAFIFLVYRAKDEKREKRE